jgi:hypothetical protein
MRRRKRRSNISSRFILNGADKVSLAASYKLEGPKPDARPGRETESAQWDPFGVRNRLHRRASVPLWIASGTEAVERRVIRTHKPCLTFELIGDPQDHRELKTGTEATAFEVKRNMDRLPEFLDPEKQLTLSGKLHGRVERWLANRLAERLEA